MGYQITLTVDEHSKERAYQLLAIAIKKKHKDVIRPYFQIFQDDGLIDVENTDLQNDLWRDEAGTSYDY